MTGTDRVVLRLRWLRVWVICPVALVWQTWFLVFDFVKNKRVWEKRLQKQDLLHSMEVDEYLPCKTRLFGRRVASGGPGSRWRSRQNG